ncbi:MAG: hypothetical protein ACP5QK_04595 [Myxococcota bacterium]
MEKEKSSIKEVFIGDGMEKETVNFINEMIEDYQKNAENTQKSPEEWLQDALKRHFPDLKEEEVEKIKNEIINGIRDYRKAKEEKTTIREVLMKARKFNNDVYQKIIGKIKEVLETIGIKQTDVLDKREGGETK